MSDDAESTLSKFVDILTDDGNVVSAMMHLLALIRERDEARAKLVAVRKAALRVVRPWIDGGLPSPEWEDVLRILDGEGGPT